MADSFSGVDTAGAIVELIRGHLDIFSAEIELAARGAMRWEEMAVRKEDLSVTKGQTIQFTRLADIARGGQLTEGTPIERKSMSGSTHSLTVTEWGNAIGITGKLNHLTWRNVMMEQAVLLSRDYALVRDLSVRSTAVGSGSTIFSSDVASSVNDLTVDNVFDVETIRKAREMLATNNVPMFEGGFYVCHAHPHQLSSLRRDPDWKQVHTYNMGGAHIFKGEVGRFEDIVFIESTNQQNGVISDTAHPAYDVNLRNKGTTGDLPIYRATFIGDQTLALGDALPVEMRIGTPEDFGRILSTAWYAIWGTSVLDSNGIIHALTA